MSTNDSNHVSRFGVLAQKLGMSRIFLERKAVAITLLKVPTSHVLEKKACDGFSVMKLGVTEAKGKVKKPQAKECEKNNKPICSLVKEFRISHEEAQKLEEQVGQEWIDLGSFVDVSSKSVGKGFAGAMKRWNFSGGPASHGASLSHRSIGSTGTRDKIFKNRKMPGRMGHENVTVQSQKIVYKDEESGIIGLLGSVPGKKGTWVKVVRAIKKHANNAQKAGE
jgi:large subunit ribosomal protein L3